MQLIDAVELHRVLTDQLDDLLEKLRVRNQLTLSEIDQ